MKVYLDNGATTPVCDEAKDAMVAVLNETYGNPSGVYDEGVKAKGIINRARVSIAESLGVFDREIIFTSGGTESDVTALFGTAFHHGKGHILSTQIEHHAVLNTLGYLEKSGFDVTCAKPDVRGVVSADTMRSLVRPDTFLISMMHVNNETGMLQPVMEVGSFAKERGIIMHTDAVASYGKLPMKDLVKQVDLLSVSAHKFNGPKGTGFLYIKRGTPIDPLFNGGGQEFSMRSGTENTAGIAGMKAAALHSFSKIEFFLEKTKSLKMLLYKLIKERISDVYVNGDMDEAVPWCLNIGIPGVNGSSLLILLDMKGICASTGATCSQAKEEPSHVLRAMGRSNTEAASSIRFTLSDLNTEEEMIYTADMLKESVDYLRSMQRL